MARIGKEDIFYTLLKQFADELLEAAEAYRDIVCGYPDTFARIPQMKVMETDCDERVKTIMSELYTSFITPFEREDISDLALALDDVIDCMNGVTKRLDLFNIHETRDEAPQLAELTLACVKEVHELIYLLPNYKKEPRVLELASKISNIEDEAGTVYEAALRRLFREDEKGRVTVAWLRLLDRMESTMHACDHVAAIVRGVVLKSA
jgi:uncharacterized protein Yka (UPF0111/DUF47 family)